MQPTHLVFAFIGGLIPALVWLWFWIREDDHPEPLRLITLSFIAGMIIVPFVIPLQKFALELYKEGSFMLIFAWAIVEEVYKYAAALILILWRRDVDEPIDFVIYMTVIAIGFSALENMLYMYKLTSELTPIANILNGTFRFIGASLVHVISSATVGVALAYAFYKSASSRLLYGIAGLILATTLHTFFNFSILAGGGLNIQTIFLSVWAAVIILLLLIEKVKRITNSELKQII